MSRSTQVVGLALVPLVEQWEWQIRGACRRVGTAEFFHPDGERGPARAEREARAKAVCLTCPVLERCRQQALDNAEPYGVWGGLTEGERRKLRASRNTTAV